MLHTALQSPWIGFAYAAKYVLQCAMQARALACTMETVPDEIIYSTRFSVAERPLGHSRV